MKSLIYVKDGVKEWARRWGSYTLLFLIISQIINWLVMPLLAWLGATILRTNGVPFVSYDNLWTIIMRTPLAAVELVLLFLLLLIFAYLQFAILILGVQHIMRNEEWSLKLLLQESARSLRHLRLSSLPLFVLYFVLVIPFGRVALDTPLLQKVRIPTFILEAVANTWWFLPAGLALVLVFFWLAIRLLRTLPITITTDKTFAQAFRESWYETQHRFWFYTWRVLWIGLISQLITWGWISGLVALQTYFDKTSFALPAAIVTMTLVQLGSLVWSVFTTSLMVFLLVSPDGFPEVPGPRQKLKRPRRRLIRVGTVVGIVALGAIFAAYNYDFMTGALDTKPRIISHRGVDGNNGVQNTIPVLEKTARKHPDFVEMDIHQTKDEQFVVMHDYNLQNLTGVNTTPRQKTLKELTAMTVRENGHSAKIPSFDEYLATAERLNQPLIVELKTTPEDTPDVIDSFLDKYAERLIKDGYPVHSLNYEVVVRAKERYPKLFVSFILPYTLMLPQTNADAYTEEETTIGQNMVDAAQSADKRIWAWTVDDPDDMRSMLFLGVDGIITDDMSTLQSVIRSENARPSYAERLKNYADDLSLMNDRNGTEN